MGRVIRGKTLRSFLMLSVLIFFAFDAGFAQQEGHVKELIEAITSWDIKAAQKIISKGIDVNKTDRGGWTPLMWACREDVEEIVLLLLKNNADPNFGTTSGVTPLHDVAIYDNMNIARILLSYGADVNARDNEGRTPLHNASIGFGNGAVALLLIEKGADVNAKAKDGSTPLHSAASSNTGITSRLIAVLVKNGADYSLKNVNGETPLDIARGKGNKEAIQSLLKISKSKPD